VKIGVDTEKCTGHAVCEGLAPDVFEVGDDGLVHLLQPSPSDDQREAIHAAVEQCPTQALTVEE
jgi:ferredoxin